MRGEPLSVLRLLATDCEAEQLRELLRTVIDPELGVDIVSLGLVYDLSVESRIATVVTTTTTPACPLGEYITTEVERVLRSSGAVDDVAVRLTHDPLWTPERMDDTARRALGWRT